MADLPIASLPATTETVSQQPPTVPLNATLAAATEVRRLSLRLPPEPPQEGSPLILM